ncbi:hypothetical protein Cs7R123_52600 [Catellatospora sp. TT07R-123]|uniref:FG-GAP-like repeat-containing protein n=1 Tax=Catellatospora sp. TT07R-123 TaxID=2733863 RepID=UPI001B1AD029|nr:FG-GAP-like repeat-containing protein [Catellatospora sp. TT07R-123]GHJ47918.1 hypothetical protein Cs7R123_52600 [Catellatospora sp. TT07R-123]
MRLKPQLLPTVLTVALVAASVAAASFSATPAPLLRPVAYTPPASTFFATTSIASHATTQANGDGDLWANCWSDDDNVYAAHGDGKGFGPNFSDIGVNRITGMPGSLAGTTLAMGDQVGQVWTANHTRKPTGMACADGSLYLAVQDLALDFDDAPAATVARSTDHGRTWSWNRSAPMFGNGVFTTIMFLDYGKNYANAVDGYVYAYGLDGNWRDSFADRVPDPVDVYLARVPRASVQTRSAWQFVSGFDAGGAPQWNSDISRRVAVLHDDRRIYPDVYTAGKARNLSVISQGGVVYDKPLNRYLYTSWTEYTFEFYESPTPWGPWKPFATKDFGGYPWTTSKHGGYATTIPSKYISADGRSVWLQSNVCPCGGGGTAVYTYSLRPMSLVPYTATGAANAYDPARNLAREPGTVPVERVAHYGNYGFYNDGNRGVSEDDWNDERKGASWWGYTWPRRYAINKVVFTSGATFADGGWFGADLRVQVRRDHVWSDVRGLKTSPLYPYNNTAGPYKTYTLGFDPVDADGVRIIGAPGGTRTFTSIAELEVYFGTYAGMPLGGSSTDLTGDGRDDAVVFTQNALADLYVGASTGSSFAGGVKWHDMFSLPGETPLTGDFNGDGKDDVVTFTRGTLGDVYVALSNGGGLGASTKWHDWFAPAVETPAVGDFNGDGKDDIMTFVQDGNGDVFVALSNGSSFGAGVKWHEFFAPPGEFPAVADFNGDGKDDIVTFTQGTSGDVYVALSNGTSFGPGVLWHDTYAWGGQTPRVGDVNGDGKADAVAFVQGGDDVYVALSNGSSFGAAQLWHSAFAPLGQFPYLSDVNGDGKADAVSFSSDGDADVWVALSTGSGFGAATKWNDFFGLAGETAF